MTSSKSNRVTIKPAANSGQKQKLALENHLKILALKGNIVTVQICIQKAS
jgi:hypothetical protein